MAQWWPPLSPALDGGRARAATGAWLPGTSVASVVEELKLDCATLGSGSGACTAARLQNAETE